MSAKAIAYLRVSEALSSCEEIWEEWRDATFLVPSSQDKDALVGRLSRAAGAKRPEVLRWGGLYLKLCDLLGVKPRRPTTPMEERFALRRIAEDLGLPHGIGDAERYRRAIKELQRDAIEPEDLEGLGGRSKALKEIYEAYLRELSSRGAIDSQRIPLEIAGMLRGFGERLPVRLAWVGFLSFTRSQLKAVLALKDLCDSIFLCPSPSPQREPPSLEQVGLGGKPRCEGLPEVLEVRCPLKNLVPELSANLLGPLALEGGCSVGLMCPEEEVFAFRDVLEGAGIATTIRRKIPLSLSRLHRLLAEVSLLRREGFPALETSSIALSVQALWGKDPLERTVARPFAPLEEGLREDLSRLDLTSLLGKSPSLPKLFERLRAGMLRASFGLPRAESRVALDEEYLRGLFELGEELRWLGVKFEELEGEAEDLLRIWADERRARVDGPLRGGVGLVPGRPSVLCSFDVWAMAQNDEESWSARVDEEVLELELRERIAERKGDSGLLLRPQAMERHTEEVYLRTILAGERVVYLVVAEGESPYRPLEPTHFLERAREELGARPLGLELHPLGREGPLLKVGVRERAETKGALRVEVPSTLDLSDLPLLSGKEACPRRYLLERVLKPQNPFKNPIPAFFGEVLHELLKETLQGEEVPLKERALELLEEKLRDLLSPEALELKASAALRTCCDVLSSWKALKREAERCGFALRSELELQLLTKVNGVSCTGRLDRLDVFERDDEAWAVVVDYKTGSLEGGEEQVKAYMWLIRRELKLQPQAGVLISLRRGTGNRVFLPFRKNRKESSSVLELLRRYAEDEGEVRGTTRDLFAEVERQVYEAIEILKEGSFDARAGARGGQCRMCPHFPLCAAAMGGGGP